VQYFIQRVFLLFSLELSITYLYLFTTICSMSLVQARDAIARGEACAADERTIMSNYKLVNAPTAQS